MSEGALLRICYAADSDKIGLEIISTARSPENTEIRRREIWFSPNLSLHARCGFQKSAVRLVQSDWCKACGLSPQRATSSPRPPESKVKYDRHVQVRVNQARKTNWQNAARVRRLSISNFVRDCADAGAATRLHQRDLLKHFRQLRRNLNAASAANQAANSIETEAQIAAAMALVRKIQGEQL